MSDIVERLKARAAWWDKLHDYVVAKRDEARGTEWFGRFNAMAHSVRGRVPVEDEAADEITRLRAEIDELRDPKLSHMRFENGCLDMALVSPVIEGLATALGGWFIAGGAKNYAEMRLHDRHETGQVYIVTVQKSGAKTPHELRAEAEAEVTRLRAEVARKDAALREIASSKTRTAMALRSIARAALTAQEKTDG